MLDIQRPFCFSSKVVFLNNDEKGSLPMKAERRTTIVREIEHWRRSKLLPDHYCDFLLNLYADPVLAPKSEEPQHAIGKAILAVSKATGLQWLIAFGSFTLISFVVLYFSSFHPALQIGIILLAAYLFLFFGERIRLKNEAVGFLTISLGHFIILAGGLYLIHFYELKGWYYNGGLIALCAIFWIIYGIKMKLSALHLCGWLAFLLSYALLLHQLTEGHKWYEIQLYWLPLAVLFGWTSWFIHRFTKPVAAILFITATLTWFMPELYTSFFIEEAIFLPIQLIIKFILVGLILFLLRKQWMVWVI